jgi:hypothetical protein
VDGHSCIYEIAIRLGRWVVLIYQVWCPVQFIVHTINRDDDAPTLDAMRHADTFRFGYAPLRQGKPAEHSFFGVNVGLELLIEPDGLARQGWDSRDASRHRMTSVTKRGKPTSGQTLPAKVNKSLYFWDGGSSNSPRLCYKSGGTKHDTVTTTPSSARTCLKCWLLLRSASSRPRL